MPIPPLLGELLRAHGASGHEEEVQAIVRREAAALGADIQKTVFGATIATISGTGGTGRRVALVAHADQVGMLVRGADADGLLTVAKGANWTAENAWRQRVRIATVDGEVRGIVTGELDQALPAWESLRIDLGAADRDEALSLVRPGDPVVPDGAPEALRNGRIASVALDDRAGVFACLEALRRLADDPPVWDVALVVSTQEESGPYPGAMTAVSALEPDVALVVEVSYAGDAPGQAAWGDVRLGGGPVIGRIPVLSPVVVGGLLATAEELEIPYAIETGHETWSDADGLAVVGAGVATGMIAIPLRYMHSASEVAQLSDIDATVDLITAYVGSLDADASFLR